MIVQDISACKVCGMIGCLFDVLGSHNEIDWSATVIDDLSRYNDRLRLEDAICASQDDDGYLGPRSQ